MRVGEVAKRSQIVGEIFAARGILDSIAESDGTQFALRWFDGRRKGEYCVLGDTFDSVRRARKGRAVQTRRGMGRRESRIARRLGVPRSSSGAHQGVLDVERTTGVNPSKKRGDPFPRFTKLNRTL